MNTDSLFEPLSPSKQPKLSQQRKSVLPVWKETDRLIALESCMFQMKMGSWTWGQKDMLTNYMLPFLRTPQIRGIMAKRMPNSTESNMEPDSTHNIPCKSY